ncbi:MAG: hypothetical protein V2A75_08055 [Pseudomonadota bacterium]
MEEYKGINRDQFPAWQGWKIVDDYKRLDADAYVIVNLCENNGQLQQLVAQFYEGGK